MKLSFLLRGGNKFSEENPMMGGEGGRMSQNRRMQVRRKRLHFFFSMTQTGRTALELQFRIC